MDELADLELHCPHMVCREILPVAQKGLSIRRNGENITSTQHSTVSPSLLFHGIFKKIQIISNSIHVLTWCMHYIVAYSKVMSILMFAVLTFYRI